jgi:hypothetical protein
LGEPIDGDEKAADQEADQAEEVEAAAAVPRLQSAAGDIEGGEEA